MGHGAWGLGSGRGEDFFGTGNFVAHPSETSCAETTFVSRDRRAALPLTVEEWCLSWRVLLPDRVPGFFILNRVCGAPV